MYNRPVGLGGRGLEWLNESGAFAVIANRKLYARGKAGKYTVVNTNERWVDSVHDSFDNAADHVQTLYLSG